MKHELIMSGLLILGNPMMMHAQQTKTTTAESVSTESFSTDSNQAIRENLHQDSIQAIKENLHQDSIQAMKEKLRQDSILWEKQLEAVTIKGTRSQFRQKNGGIVARISFTFALGNKFKRIG